MGAATEMQVWELPADRVALTSAPRRLRREVGGQANKMGREKGRGVGCYSLHQASLHVPFLHVPETCPESHMSEEVERDCSSSL